MRAVVVLSTLAVCAASVAAHAGTGYSNLFTIDLRDTQPGGAPAAGFSWSPQGPSPGAVVSFNDSSAGSPAMWRWDFDGDGVWDSTAQSPTYTFSTPGPQPVTLRVTNPYASDQITKTVPVAGSAGTPTVTGVARQYRGFFLDGVTVTNTFDVTVDWEGDPGSVGFSINGGPPTTVPGDATGASHTFNMGADFPPAWTGSTVSFTPTNGGGSGGSAHVENVFVFPYPTWLADAISIGFGDLSITAGQGQVRFDLASEFPRPHFREGCTLACAVDPGCGDCLRIPSFVPYVNGAFDILETYATIQGHLVSTGTGNLSLYGQTGFYALGGGDAGGGVLGTASGSGDFQLLAPGGLELTQASFTLDLEGLLTKEVGILDAVPALAGAEGWPVIGGIMGTINDVATLRGELRPSLGLAAHFAQDASGALVFSNGTGNLGLDMLATLEIPISERIFLRGWVGGGGDFTLGVPEPLLRELNLRFQTGAEIHVDALFDLCARAELNAECVWTPGSTTACTTQGSLGGPWCDDEAVLAGRVPVRPIERDYTSFGEYSELVARPLAKRASSRVPVSVTESVIVSNVFPGLSPEIVEVPGGALLLWEHQDVADPVLQSTEISWSLDTGGGWSAPAIVNNDTRVELSPEAALDDQGRVVAAWLRVADPAFDTPLADIADLPLFYGELEVVTSTLDTALGTWSGITPLTADTALDTDLVLSAGPGGELLLTWLSNPAGEFLSTVTNPSTLRFAEWNSAASSWGGPADVATGLVGVANHSAAAHSAAAFVIVERDPDPAQAGDSVLDLFSFDGGNWAGPTTFAAGGVDNVAAAAAYDATGEGHVVWVRDGDLVHATLSAPTPEVIRSATRSLAFFDVELLVNAAGNVSVLWQEAAQDGPANVFAKVYDPASDTWSVDRQLNETDWQANQLDGAYGSDGILRAAFAATEIARVAIDVDLNESTVTIPNIPVPGQTDLRVLEHSLVVDLAVVDDDLSVVPPTPAPGDSVLARLDVHNAGDFATGALTVELWVGEPGVGTLVDSASVPSPFRAGDSLTLDFAFDQPGGGGNIVAVVDSGDAVTEISEANNTARHYLDNTAPDAVVFASVTSGMAPLTVDFDGTYSGDDDGDAITYRWAFGDGSANQTGDTVTHQFTTSGAFPVTLTVTDEHGAVGTAVVVITVAADPDLPFADGFETGDTSAWSAVTP